MVTIGRAFIEGCVRATWLLNSTTRACPTRPVEALARGTETTQHVTVQSAAASAATATLKVPRREPRDLRVVSDLRAVPPERVIR
jgi:hypothetical protein